MKFEKIAEAGIGLLLLAPPWDGISEIVGGAMLADAFGVKL